MSTELSCQQSSLFPRDKIAHGFFGARGGVSEGLYTSLNVDYRRDDDIEHVRENRQRILRFLSAAEYVQDLITVQQVHGDECRDVRSGEAILSCEADALVTDVAQVPLSILTADCVPVLFYGTKADGSPVIGAAHAGWRGAISGILQSTITRMGALGVTSAAVITAVIGPCIGAASYEVSDEFMQPFLLQNEDHTAFFTSAQRQGHQMFDICAYVQDQLAVAGIGHIESVTEDTYACGDKYFSHRRMCHENLEDTGRQASVIMIR